MAQLKGFGIDLGQHSVKLVELIKDRSGVHVAGAKVVFTGISSAMSKEAKDNAVISALKKALEGVDTGLNPISIATPGSAAFIRYVKLPPVTPQRLKQIIGYEAQQQVPFPLNEVVWDYQVLDIRSEAETNVVLVAIKKDVLSALINQVKSCGVEPSFVEHRPLAVFNSLKFNYADEAGGIIVIIDVGERSTDISVERDGELCWTRNVRAGSYDITEAIRKKYNTSPQEAETLKEQALILSSAEDEKSADPKTLELWNVIKGPVTSIAAELQRTINYFQTQLGGAKPDKIIIAGGLSMMPNFDVLLSSVIGADVEKLNPLKNITAPEGILSGIDAGAQLSVAIGLGLRSLDLGFSTVNLLPESIVSRQQLRKKRSYLVLSGLSLALMVGIASVFSVENYNVARRNVENVKEDLDVYQDYNSLIREEQSKQGAIESRTENVQKLVSRFWRWPDFMLETAKVIPEGVVVSSMRFVAAGETRETTRRAPRQDFRHMEGDPMGMGDFGAIPAVQEPGKKNLELRGRADDFDKISLLVQMVENSPRFKSIRIISAVPVVVSRSRQPDARSIQPDPRSERGMLPPVESSVEPEVVEREYIEFTVSLEVEGDFS